MAVPNANCFKAKLDFFMVFLMVFLWVFVWVFVWVGGVYSGAFVVNLWLLESVQLFVLPKIHE